MSINIDPPARDDRTLREKLGMPLPQRPMPLAASPQGKALDAALAQDDLTAVLDALAPADLDALAKAALRLWWGCVTKQGAHDHHGYKRWDFST